MSWRPLLCVLAVWALTSSAVEERKVHRLIGGHFRIYHEDPQDAEFLIASASDTKNKKPDKDDNNGGDEKKTLSQQVADGKYGLIQKELFSKPSKRPGVISYESNPEVPTDNINNLGGLTKNDIWLAENHLLVIKGGTYPPHEDSKNDNVGPVWPAIDDYKAPLRQVKIPAHPKVPPPFPVQLTDDGPLQILGTNSSRTINGSFEEAVYALPPPEGYEPGTGPFYPNIYPYPPNSSAGQSPVPIPAYPQGEYEPGAPFPPFNLNGTLPPFFASLPPGAAILPPPNQTEPFDEDDPSIYYPPPYSFYYPKDNSSAVPAGPLVPGIILPPPPNFFAPFEEETTTRRTSRIRPTTTTILPQIRPTTTEIPPTSILNDKTTKKPYRVFAAHTPSEINNELNPIVTTTTTTTTEPPNVVTILPVPVRKYPVSNTRFNSKNNNINNNNNPQSVTILKPVKTFAYNNNEVTNKPFNVYGPPQRTKTVISTTQVPLKVYYSTANDIETNSITQPPEKYHIGVAKSTTKSPAQYYFYEEQNKRNRVPTTRKPQFYDIPKEYYQSNQAPQNQQFVYVTARPYNTQRPRYRFVQQTPKASDTFSVHVAKLQKQIHQYYTTPRPVYRQSPKPVYQFSFQAANYRPQEDPQDKFRPLPKYSVQIQPAVEITQTQEPPIYYNQQPQNINNYQGSTERPVPTKYYSSTSPRPDYEYEDVDEKQKNAGTPRPISQYSFEMTPNPIYQGYYTKPDEGYFDENTKQYFTSFGRKIPSGTTPIPQTRQRPVSLQSDTNVNYLNPRPNINPNAEFIPSTVNNNYPQVVKYAPRPAQYVQKPVQKEGPEIIKAVPVEVPDGDPGSFISYRLPGDDGAHFYFLTPQLAQRRDQGAGYYYSQPNVPRSRRNNER